MKIFLDDYRKAGEGYTQVWTYKQCIKLLDKYRDSVVFVSLDYDLGRGDKSGYDVLVYMKENGIKPNHINIHSDHSEGTPKMTKYAEDNFKGTEVTINQI